MCDLPYGMGAQINAGAEGAAEGAAEVVDAATTAAAARGTRQPAGGAAVLRARQRSTDVYVAALLLLASTALRPGGRLACFVPVFGVVHAEAALPSLLEPLMPPSAEPGAPSASGGGLRVVAARQQTFSPTFARWLVCFERDVPCHDRGARGDF